MMRANAAYTPNSAYSQTDEDILVAKALQLGFSGFGATHNTVGPQPVPGCDLQRSFATPPLDGAHMLMLTRLAGVEYELTYSTVLWWNVSHLLVVCICVW